MSPRKLERKQKVVMKGWRLWDAPKKVEPKEEEPPKEGKRCG
jgi:hypothetical protein